MTTEDFSFPTENFPSSAIDSPPLWRSSPAGPGVDSRQEITSKEEEKLSTSTAGTKPADFNQRRSLSGIGHGRRMAKRDVEKKAGMDQEEQMDLLWEDFNEELSRADSDKFSGDHHMVELGCVESLKLSRTRNNKPRSMAVVLKTLKKLFLLQNNSPPSPSPHHPYRHHYPSKLKTNRPW